MPCEVFFVARSKFYAETQKDTLEAFQEPLSAFMMTVGMCYNNVSLPAVWKSFGWGGGADRWRLHYISSWSRYLLRLLLV